MSNDVPIQASNMGYWVAIISIVTSSIASIYSTSVAESLKFEVESLKIEFSQGERKWKRHYAQCDRFFLASENLAKAYGAVNKEYKMSRQAELEGALWAAIPLLPKDVKKVIINKFEKGPSKDDKYGLIMTHQMVGGTLIALSDATSNCLG